MLSSIPDSAILLLYTRLILPWEKELKHKSNGWSINRSKQALNAMGFLYERVTVSMFKRKLSALRRNARKSFVLFTPNRNIAKDIIGGIRNSFAHANVTYVTKGSGNSELHFESYNVKSPRHLVMYARVHENDLLLLINALSLAVPIDR